MIKVGDSYRWDDGEDPYYEIFEAVKITDEGFIEYLYHDSLNGISDIVMSKKKSNFEEELKDFRKLTKQELKLWKIKRTLNR